MNEAARMSSLECSETLVHALRGDEDVVRVRTLVRERALEIGLSLIDQTKLVTAASEIARNTVRYGGGGEVHITLVTKGAQRGCRLQFIDRGPGIADVEQALVDGYTTSGGLGLGLGGTRRLVDEFSIETEVGAGTTVTLIKWKRF
jgi:serine/threonine-protein kinase RsbT